MKICLFTEYLKYLKFKYLSKLKTIIENILGGIRSVLGFFWPNHLKPKRISCKCAYMLPITLIILFIK